MLITGGRLFTANGFIDADVIVHGDVVTRIIPRAAQATGLLGESAGADDSEAPDACSAAYDEQVIDATGCLVCPGLVDLHFHGCRGSDFCDGAEQAIATIARYQASRGVTAICPATMTYPEERLGTVMGAAAHFSPTADEATLVGINMEGPFISPNKVGAQNPAYVQPCDLDMFRRLQERAGGLIKLVDVAPEEPGALAFIREVAASARVSVAHTCCDYECAAEAFSAGARQLTHTYNAMPGLHHRAPGPIAAAAEHDEVTAEIIADGVHVHPAMVRLAFGLFGSGRVILISDSMRACGMGDGTFDLGGQDVHVKGPVAKLADGTIAGSVSDLARCVQVAVNDMGIDPWDAVCSASHTPARALGIDGDAAGGHGRIEPGCIANIVLFDENMEVRNVVLRGALLDARENA